MNLDDYAEQLRQEIIAAAEAAADGALRQEVFTDLAIERLTGAGELDGGTVAFHQARGVQVSGWSLDEDEGALHLFVTDYHDEVPPASLSATVAGACFKRLREFVQRCLNGYGEQLEESSPAFELADVVARQWKIVQSVKLYLFSDARAARDLRVSDEIIDGVPVTHHVWDLERFHRLDTSGAQREAITVDVAARLGKPLQCLRGPDEADHTVYLAIVPGTLLASLYSEYGARLLERNVRSFLQARGGVNKGIKTSIANEPERFLAYNNGISATASRIFLDRLSDGGFGISKIDDLQIVNGGQTTASIHNAAVREGLAVTDVFVQAKITVVAPELIDDLVPSISRYANMQNKVTGADFSANDPVHVRLEELSRSIWAPAPDGSQRQTHWFYERARGQYADEVIRAGTPAKQRQFKITNPTAQKFTKTDLAKFEHAWEQLPHLVSLGAEKNFREYMLRLAARGDRDLDQEWFSRVIAKAILFRSTEKIVSAQQFGGYRANIVAYTIAKLAHATQHRIDLERMWRNQKISDALSSAIAELSRLVHPIVTKPSGRVQHVGEWCKKLDCWKAVEEIDWTPPAGLQKELIKLRSGTGQAKNLPVDRGLATPTDGEVDLVLGARAIEADTWFAVANWARETESLQAWQRGLAYSLGKLASNGRDPSIKQATHGLRLLEEARRLGFSESAGTVAA